MKLDLQGKTAGHVSVPMIVPIKAPVIRASAHVPLAMLALTVRPICAPATVRSMEIAMPLESVFVTVVLKVRPVRRRSVPTDVQLMEPAILALVPVSARQIGQDFAVMSPYAPMIAIPTVIALSSRVCPFALATTTGREPLVLLPSARMIVTVMECAVRMDAPVSLSGQDLPVAPSSVLLIATIVDNVERESAAVTLVSKELPVSCIHAWMAVSMVPATNPMDNVSAKVAGKAEPVTCSCVMPLATLMETVTMEHVSVMLSMGVTIAKSCSAIRAVVCMVNAPTAVLVTQMSASVIVDGVELPVRNPSARMLASMVVLVPLPIPVNARGLGLAMCARNLSATIAKDMPLAPLPIPAPVMRATLGAAVVQSALVGSITFAITMAFVIRHQVDVPALKSTIFTILKVSRPHWSLWNHIRKLNGPWQTAIMAS